MDTNLSNVYVFDFFNPIYFYIFCICYLYFKTITKRNLMEHSPVRSLRY